MSSGLSPALLEELRKELNIKGFRKYETDWYEHLSLLDQGESEGLQPFHVRHAGGQPEAKPWLVKTLILKTRWLRSLPQAAHHILDQALLAYSEEDAVPMTKESQVGVKDGRTSVSKSTKNKQTNENQFELPFSFCWVF